MAITIGSLIDGLFSDSVVIYDTEFNPLFPQVKISKLSVRPRAQLMQHPVETGIMITDYRVVQPTEIEMGLFVEFPGYKDAYRALRQAFILGTELVIQTKSSVYPRQIIAALPHQETADAYNALVIGLSLKEVIQVPSGEIISPEDPQDANTIGRGELQGGLPGDARATIAGSLFAQARALS